jgi:hypothetical protein
MVTCCTLSESARFSSMLYAMTSGVIPAFLRAFRILNETSGGTTGKTFESASCERVIPLAIISCKMVSHVVTSPTCPHALMTFVYVRMSGFSPEVLMRSNVRNASCVAAGVLRGKG